MDCNLPIKLGNVPVSFEKPIYGSYDTDFKHSMAPPMVNNITKRNSQYLLPTT